ncbi:protein activity of BC1 complex kinase 8, chloroplastic [Tanacetum coccineum]
MNVHISNLDSMRPFAESVLKSYVNSDVEVKLRRFLVELGNADKILGIQVCAYKDGEVIIDTPAGVLTKYDPRPVQPDSLFHVFSVTKGVTAGMVHWLADKGHFIFSTDTDGKIKAWLYNTIASRVDYTAPGHSSTRMAYSVDGTRLPNIAASKKAD